MNSATLTGFMLLLLNGSLTFAQEKEVFLIEDDRIVFRVDLTHWGNEFDSLMSAYGMPAVSLDSLLRLHKVSAGISGWQIRLVDQRILELEKPLKELSGSMDPETPVSLANKEPVYYNYAVLHVPYGINAFRKPFAPFSERGEKTIFVLRDYQEARAVFLSGSFNGWSVTQDPMTKTDSGWIAAIPLSAGKHHYKYIVDGRWVADPDNRLRERNEVGSYNSVYFKYNYSFRLSGFREAKKVTVAGSFNGWNPRELSMVKTPDGWTLPLYLREGTHAYKFIVDEQWLPDPANAVTRTDGAGNVNSYLALGDTIHFTLQGYEQADRVFVSGDFNGWNPGELQMNKTDGGWELPYTLAAGNYLYKFIVDGRWLPAPNNPHTQGSGDYVNSVLVIRPNQTFVLEGYGQAREVRLTGNLNAWDTHGYTLARKEGKWQIALHLKPGKYIYKFIVDGEYILDPANPYWEQNEYGTGNSVLWVTP